MLNLLRLRHHRLMLRIEDHCLKGFLLHYLEMDLQVEYFQHLQQMHNHHLLQNLLLHQVVLV